MNKWKVAFLLLLGVVLFAVAAVIYLILGPVEQVQKPAGGNATGSTISIETTAQEFETIARQYIGPSLKNSPMPVDFAINEQIQLFSTFTIFTVDVPITMDFEPIVEENGNVTLQQTTMNVGKLNIPPSSVLKLLKDSVDFPDWITVNANEALIYVDLSRINIANGSRVRAKQFDLATDKIELEIIVPND